jgi:hypothetical protein
VSDSAVQDFREIAHSGGKITFDIHSDAEGKKQFRVTFTGSRPVPMSMFAVYALPQGIPVGDIQLGGIGQPWNPPPHRSCIPVFIASDSEGLFGHECPDCGNQQKPRTGLSVLRRPSPSSLCGALCTHSDERPR